MKKENFVEKTISQIPEIKSLRWLANQFPYIENPKDDTDRLSNAIHVYCTAGANKIEELAKTNFSLKIENCALLGEIEEGNNDNE